MLRNNYRFDLSVYICWKEKIKFNNGESACYELRCQLYNGYRSTNLSKDKSLGSEDLRETKKRKFQE